MNQCENCGVSVGDCSQFLNIALLNGDSINVGGSSTAAPSSSSVNNGQEFVNHCNNSGISIFDCAQVLNVAALNGLTIDISMTDLEALLAQLGTSTTALGGLTGGSGSSMVAMPTSLPTSAPVIA